MDDRIELQVIITNKLNNNNKTIKEQRIVLTTSGQGIAMIRSCNSNNRY
jgi:hypothetical protein